MSDSRFSTPKKTRSEKDSKISNRRRQRGSPMLQRFENRLQEATHRRNLAQTAAPAAFGSGMTRAIKPPHIYDPEKTPDPGNYHASHDSAKLNRTFTFVDPGSKYVPPNSSHQTSPPGFPPLPLSPHASATSLWRRSLSPRMSTSPQRPHSVRSPTRGDCGASVSGSSTFYNSGSVDDLGPGTYSPHLCQDSISHSSGSVLLSTKHASSSFATKTKRFFVPAVVKTQIPDSKWDLEQDASTWKSRGVYKPKRDRFTQKDVYIEAKGFLSIPNESPGYLYDPEDPASPTIKAMVKRGSESPSRCFMDTQVRFKDKKNPYTRSLGPETYGDAWSKWDKASKSPFSTVSR